MALLNRFLAFLIFVAGAVALVYSFLLFERRAQLRNHSETLAKTVADVADVLANNSETTEQEQLTKKDLSWQAHRDAMDPTTKSFDKYESNVKKAVDLAQKIREQRDNIAVAVQAIGSSFEFDGTRAEDIQSVLTYQESLTTLQEQLTATRNRDRALAGKVEAIAAKIGLDIPEGTLLDNEGYAGPLDNFADQVADLDKRAEDFRAHIAQITTKIDEHKEFEVNVDALKGPNYATELTALLNDFNNINDKLRELEKTTIELTETQSNLERTITALDDASNNIARLQNKNANLLADNKLLRKRLDDMTRDMQQQVAQGGASGATLKKLSGSIIDVNYDWNYVIIDLGAKDNLPPKLEMIVARDKEYICRVVVSKVYDDYAVAEVLPELKKGKVLEGDRVIF
jgi:chromosome segregation ATPase